MLIYLNSVRIVGVALCGCECGLRLCAHSIFAAFQRLAVYRELLILNDFVFHSPKDGAEVDGAGDVAGSGRRSVLVATFVQREICGTDSSCLPTTMGQVETRLRSEGGR